MSDSGRPVEMPPTIGRYQVHESIGYGAMGAVYKAFDPLIKRTLAIKTIRLDIPRKSPQYKSFIERFYHEARISGTLSHPNIVTLFDIGEENGLPFLAMEFVEGETIAALVDRGFRFKPEKVIGLISQIASAVDYAHSKGVIHRDIKPSNLILYEGERVKVTDFGIAKLVDAEMTQSGTLLGTPSYMSPEQAMGDKLDGRSDIFSLGVCAFEMLAGEQPFPGNNVTSILYKLVHVDPIEPANLEMNGLVPQKWHEVFGKVLAKRPDERYQTATEFVQDLEYCLGAWFGSAMGDSLDSALTPMSTPPPGALGTGSRQSLTPRPGSNTGQRPLGGSGAAPGSLTGARTPAAPARDTGMRAVTTSTPPPMASPLAQTNRGFDALPDDGPLPTVHMPVMDPDPVPVDEDFETPTVMLPSLSAPPPVARGSEEAPSLPTVMMPTVEPDIPVPPTVMMSAAQAASLAKPAKPARAATPAEPPRTAPMPRTPPPPPRPAPAPPVPTTTRSRIPDEPAPAMAGVPASTDRPPSRTPLILGGIGLLVLAALIGVGLGYMGRGSMPADPGAAAVTTMPAPPASTAVAAAPTAGLVHVETVPPGATVLVNGESKGATPLDVANLPFGTYNVSVQLNGHDTVTRSVTLSAEAARSDVNVTLAATVTAASGSAEIVSNPAGARVTVDGRAVGQTPLPSIDLKPGTHRIEITKDGFQTWTGTFTVQSGKRARVEGKLVSADAPPPPPTQKAGPAVNTDRIYANTTAEVDVVAKKVKGSSASYPSKAPRLKSGESVAVTLSYVVTEDGRTTDIKVVESAGKLLDDAVVNAVEDWRFTPAMKRGVKVKVKVPYRQRFQAP